MVGDFNLPSIDRVNLVFTPAYHDFMDTIFEMNLQLHVLYPTRDDAILDLIFSDFSDIVMNIDIIELLGTSDQCSH